MVAPGGQISAAEMVAEVVKVRWQTFAGDGKTRLAAVALPVVVAAIELATRGCAAVFTADPATTALRGPNAPQHPWP